MKATEPIHDETAASLTGRARTDALHALRVLSEASESGDEADIPPLPERLRDQWQEAYGEKVPAAATPQEGWLSRLAALLKSPRFAWGGGLAAAAAVVVLMLQPPDSLPTGGGGNIVTRGGAHNTATGTAAGIVVVAPADSAAPLLAELARAFPARSIERADAAPANPGSGTLIIDAAAGLVRRGAETFALKDNALTSPAAVIMAIESLDEPEPR